MFWTRTGSVLKHLRFTRSQLAGYLSGCLAFSCGAYLFIHSHLGVDPLDVLALGVLRHLPLTVGICQAAVAAICILIWAAWYRRRPVLSPFFTFFFCGSLIDLLRWSRVAEIVALDRYVSLLSGVILCAYGSSLIIMSGIGIRAMDLVAIGMVDKWRWPFWAAKGSLEGVLLLTGYLLGGPVGVGTLCFLAFVDTLIQPMMWLNSRMLRLPNLGIPQLSRLPVPHEGQA